MENSGDKILNQVLNGFLNAEYGYRVEGDTFRPLGAESGKPWDQFDTHMTLLVWLTDDELYREASLAHEYHTKGNARCTEAHQAGEECAIPLILFAIKALLDRYEDGGAMTENDRYIIEYYLCLEQGNMIITDEDVAK